MFLILNQTLFVRQTYRCPECSEALKIHFIHGSYPTDSCTDQRIRVGGRWGGHVELEVGNEIYGFEFADRNNIHLFPRFRSGKYNSTFTCKPMTDWQQETENDKITSFVIPISVAQKEQLCNRLTAYRDVPPYDYSFLGMRCTSSAYELLAQQGVFAERSRWNYIITAFYPRQLRRGMVRWAQRNGLRILRKEGIDCRVWD